MKTPPMLRRTVPSLNLATRLSLLACAALLSLSTESAEEPSLADKAKQTVEETKATVTGAVEDARQAVQEAGEAATDSFASLWKRVDENRLKNRTRDEIAAWIIMGVLVGALAGTMTALNTSGFGKLGRLLLGLAGAMIGGMVVHVGQINFGWGPVMIRYEELLFSLLGAVVLIILGRFIRSRANKSPAPK